ncbi:helix-turn-helix domain-containing protein [Butyrivibrio sp. AE3004]|uniref:helix-turn-helix domain-containing protein n=1 Tax=Butyrivibrio sp. AE3004 TaxID=1506994 RepID=UPI000494A621|nr:helix-turn-helix transcriptional regulator [Butyrivibrio sp. AE3004]
MSRGEVGNKIKELRQSYGFKQLIIADYLEVDQSLISQIEKGEREPSSGIIKKLSDLFDCNVSTFIEGNSKNNQLNVVYRSKDITKEDLKAIAAINRIALNLEKMQHLESNKT